MDRESIINNVVDKFNKSAGSFDQDERDYIEHHVLRAVVTSTVAFLGLSEKKNDSSVFTNIMDIGLVSKKISKEYPAITKECLKDSIKMGLEQMDNKQIVSEIKAYMGKAKG